MEVLRASRRGRVYYQVSLRPEWFALSLYLVVLSVLVANLLWLHVLYLCSWLEALDMDYLVDQLICVHLVFAAATTYVWWSLDRQRGNSVLTHLLFYVWQGSKLMAASLEICSFSRFYDKLINHTSSEQISALTHKMAWAFVVTGVVELYGFVLAYNYLRVKTVKKPISVSSMAV